MTEKLMSKKKPFFPITKELNEYLSLYNRNLKIPIFYEDLKRFSGSVVVYNKNDKDTPVSYTHLTLPTIYSV